MENQTLQEKIDYTNKLSLKELQNEIKRYPIDDQKALYRYSVKIFWRPSYLDEYDKGQFKRMLIKGVGLAFLYPLVMRNLLNGQFVDKFNLRKNPLRKALIYKHGVILIGLISLPLVYDTLSLFTRVALKKYYSNKFFEKVISEKS